MLSVRYLIATQIKQNGFRIKVCRNFTTTTSSNNSEQQYSYNKSKNFNTLKLVAIGTGIGATFGTLSSLYDNYKSHGVDYRTSQRGALVLDKFPDNVRITKRFINPNDKSNLELVLFQYQTCPFCCKVRSYLDYNGISYSVVEVDAVLRQDISWSKTKKVPTVLIKQKDGCWVQMNDSSAIISLLATYLYDKGKVDIDELTTYYPTVSFNDENNKPKDDILNKYFLMYNSDVPKNFSSYER